MSAVYDENGRLAGSIEAEPGRVAAFAFDGRRIGSYENAPNAIRAVLSHWRFRSGGV